MARLTILCQLNGGCMGCCGRDFLSKEKIKEAVKQNSLEFSKANPKVKAQFLKFRNRVHPDDLRFGVCRNLVEVENQLICPLHPSLHKNNDLRKGHCDLDYLCRPAKEFLIWNREKQEKFVKFIKLKRLGHLDYSLKMVDGSLLREFEIDGQ